MAPQYPSRAARRQAQLEAQAQMLQQLVDRRLQQLAAATKGSYEYAVAHSALAHEQYELAQVQQQLRGTLRAPRK